MKKKLIITLIIFPLIAFSQSKQITLGEAISIAKKKSPDYKINLNRNQASYWRFRNYKASFLPELQMTKAKMYLEPKINCSYKEVYRYRKVCPIPEEPYR